MNYLYLPLIFVIGVLADTAWVALFRAQREGKFRILRDIGGTFGFVSNSGTFTTSQSSQSLSYVTTKHRGTLKFSDIKGLEFRVDVKFALVEELFFGFDFTDLMPQYQDTVEWFSIVAVASDGKRIPLYFGGQYQPREFLMGWYIECQTAILARLGLFKDVEEQSRLALDLIRSRIGDPRLL